MDTVADLMTRIKNGYMARKDSVILSYSKIGLVIANLLVANGYLKKATLNETKDSPLKSIVVTLKYQGRQPVLNDVKRVSKPGLRVYRGKAQIPSVLNGLGIAIISTPKGVMTDRQARKLGVGGEVLAYIW